MSAKKDNIRIWTEKIFKYVKLVHNVSGVLIDLWVQLSVRDNEQSEPAPDSTGSAPSTGRPSDGTTESGLLSEDGASD